MEDADGEDQLGWCLIHLCYLTIKHPNLLSDYLLNYPLTLDVRYEKKIPCS